MSPLTTRPRSELTEPHAIDERVGANVRRIRRRLRVSQGALAQRVGVTFQQMQKYESGANRISASRLFEISIALGVSVQSLYRKLPENAVCDAPVCKVDKELLDAFARLGPDQQGLLLRLATLMIEAGEA